MEPVATLERDNANAVVAFEVAYLHAAAGRHRQIDGEAGAPSEVAERIEMASVARHDFREDLLGNERGSAHIVEAQLHIGSLARGL